ncbi:MAG: FAD-dependent oxidoreductase [Myxococcales bacterium]|nr:FAD-dependent oxidoreductase [Myxococcales bacterium]
MAKNSSKANRKISRRQFLGATATLAIGGVAVPGTGSGDVASKFADCDYDVIIIGGGNAGVAAARDSMENGYKTLLLEARNRLGGRTFSSEFDGDKVELGGAWIHHTQPFVWAEVERYELEITEAPGADPDTMYVIMDGKRTALSEKQYVEVAAGWGIYHRAARSIMPRVWDILHNRDAALTADKINAIEHLDSLELSPLQYTFIFGFISGMASNHPQQMSYLEVMRWHLAGGGFFPTFMDSVVRFSLKDGTASLINKMIEDGAPEVRLSSVVKSVEDRGDKVIVTTVRGDHFSCDAVINCLPMNTIADIKFTPALPKGVVEAGKKRHCGSGLKIYIKVRGDVGNIATVAVGNPFDYVMTYKQASGYTLLVAFGKDPAAVDVYDDEDVQKALDAHLPGVEVLSTMSYDWNNDPYAKGTWAVYRPGWVNKYYDQFQKDYGRIFFGSSDHGEGWRGFIDGAIGGGIKAAQRVNEFLG